MAGSANEQDEANSAGGGRSVFPALSRKKRFCFGHNDIINLLTSSLFG